jgi:signal transduction histidine kinase
MIELNIRPHGVNELTDKALVLAQDRLQLNEIKVQKDYVKPDVMIPADDEKIVIALLNIIINGIEAMTPSKGLLTIRTERQKDKVLIMITDNGPGIPEDTRARLFDPFFTNKPKGTGLGLTSTQNIIMNHKGTVHVESEIDNGSTFTIVLPVNL